MGLVPACSTPPTDGMVVSTNTAETRKMRKIIVELLLANHSESCPTCQKSTTCQLQALARRLGITKVRFKKHGPGRPGRLFLAVAREGPEQVRSLRRLRARSAPRSSPWAPSTSRTGAPGPVVIPSFGKDLDKVECVNCGQCARICPTGALTPRSEVEEVWKSLQDPGKVVVAQVAPAVRVAIGEMFGMEPGVTTTGQIGAALRTMGFDKVFDTSFAADLTVIEESNEFIKRVGANERMPQFTSCCPAWVKFVEQYYPEFVDHLSTCRSPQQMFGSLSKEVLSATMGMKKEDIVVVSIMPCTAKKFEARRPEFGHDGISRRGPCPHHAGVGMHDPGGGAPLQGAGAGSLRHAFRLQDRCRASYSAIRGGVSEAVLRYVTEKLTGEKRENYQFSSVRGEGGIREASLKVEGREFSLAVVSGLGNARGLIERIKSGEMPGTI